MASIGNVPVNISFIIDDGIGQSVTISLISKNTTNLDIQLFGPGNFVDTSSTSNTEVLSLDLHGVSEVGEAIYSFFIIYVRYPVDRFSHDYFIVQTQEDDLYLAICQQSLAFSHADRSVLKLQRCDKAIRSQYI